MSKLLLEPGEGTASWFDEMETRSEHVLFGLHAFLRSNAEEIRLACGFIGIQPKELLEEMGKSLGVSK